jgi:hypothetical protein
LSSIQFFGLLHLADEEYSAVNLKVRNFTEQIGVYVSNASLLSKSLEAQSLDFTLLTNNKSKLIELAGDLCKNLRIEQIECKITVPSGINFYSAHYKVEVFRHIGTLDIDYAIFCDLDMVCLAPLPVVFETIVSQGIPLIYDITDQIIPEYGQEVMIDMFHAIHSEPSEGRWVGGEFMGGSPNFFEILTLQIETILPIYFEKVSKGSIATKGNDEVYSTAAIEILKRSGIYISDAGLLNIVGRFWSSGTLHIQKPLRYFEKTFLLHLPANKNFLSNFDSNHQNFDSDLFIAEYKKLLRTNKIKSLPRAFLYLLFAIKSRTFLLKSLKIR